MLRYRLAALALAAGLGLLQGCTTSANSCSSCGIGHGQILQRLGLGHRHCEGTTVSSGTVIYDGPVTGAPNCDGGPYLPDPNGAPGVIPTIPTQPRLVPQQPQQAIPTPAPPNGVSRTKILDSVPVSK